MKASMNAASKRRNALLAVATCLSASAAVFYVATKSEPGVQGAASSEAPESVSPPAAIEPLANAAPDEGRSGRPNPRAPAGESFAAMTARIDAMSEGEIKADVERLQLELERTDAFTRLSNGDVSAEERRVFDVTLQELALLRHALVRSRLDALGERAKAYQREHADLLAKYRGPRRD